MVRNIKKGRNGTILITASFGGVLRYDPKRAESFQHFTSREGLANNSVMSIYEDKAGIIWFGTGGGVSCYDPRRAVGKSFRNFTTKDGLPNNGITDIMEDKTGRLWIGTSSGACFYDGKTFTAIRNKEGKAFNNVRGLTEDKKGNIWTTGSANPNGVGAWKLFR